MQDCAGRPSRSLPHTEMLHYVDSQVGAQAKIQCYTESLGGSSPWSRAVCTDQGDWYTNIQCKGRINWYNWIGNVYEFFSLQCFIAHKHFVIGTRTGLELVFKLQACIKLNLFLIKWNWFASLLLFIPVHHYFLCLCLKFHIAGSLLHYFCCSLNYCFWNESKHLSQKGLILYEWLHCKIMLFWSRKCHFYD